MNTKNHLHKLFGILVVLALSFQSLRPGGFIGQVHARGYPQASEALPEGFEDGTPFQQSLKHTMAERAGQGLPTPAQVSYETKLLEKSDRRTLVSGRTEIHFTGPERSEERRV